MSIGAAYAMNVYRDEVKRVAIVDFGKNFPSIVFTLGVSKLIIL